MSDESKAKVCVESPRTSRLGKDNLQPLDEDAIVWFTLDGGDVSCRLRDGRLEVWSDGAPRIDVRPHSGNVVTVGIVPRGRRAEGGTV